jgi:hypothetical protein
VAQLVALLTAILGIACIANFLFLIDYAARLLRPVSVVASLGNDGELVVMAVYPEPTVYAAKKPPCFSRRWAARADGRV